MLNNKALTSKRVVSCQLFSILSYFSSFPPSYDYNILQISLVLLFPSISRSLFFSFTKTTFHHWFKNSLLLLTLNISLLFDYSNYIRPLVQLTQLLVCFSFLSLLSFLFSCNFLTIFLSCATMVFSVLLTNIYVSHGYVF